MAKQLCDATLPQETGRISLCVDNIQCVLQTFKSNAMPLVSTLNPALQEKSKSRCWSRGTVTDTVLNGHRSSSWGFYSTNTTKLSGSLLVCVHHSHFQSQSHTSKLVITTSCLLLVASSWLRSKKYCREQRHEEGVNITCPVQVPLWYLLSHRSNCF